jgi:diacylglycerol kinase family enzyme
MPSLSELADGSLAVVLNKNARSVKAPIQRLISKLVPADHIYVSESREHGREIAHEIVDRGYRTVATGGGDGTFVTCVSDIYDYIDQQEAKPEPPRFFVLKLGTGNAVAATFGASRPTPDGLAHDLERARLAPFCRRLPVLSVEGKLTPFAGCGLDARVQFDYYNHKAFFSKHGLSYLASGGPGYVLSVACRTLPHQLLDQPAVMRVYNAGGPGFRVKDGGQTLDPVAPGQLLYDGAAVIASASTIPYTGLNMRLFPYARLRDDKFHFRVSDLGTVETLFALPSIWRGKFQSERIHDYLVDRVRVESETPIPLQIGGDLAGTRNRIEIGLSRNLLEMAG